MRRAQAGGLASLEPAEIDLLGRLYRKATSDLSYARFHVKDPSVLEYLNLLVMRAHAQVYRPRKRRGSFLRFFTQEFPRVYRQTLVFTLVATAVFFAAAAYAFVVARSDPAMGEQFLPAFMRESTRGGYGEGPTAPGEPGPEVWAVGPALSVGLFVWNITYSFIAFAGGIVFGLVTLLALIRNGLMLGALGGIYWGSASALSLWALILPHGSLELPAIFLCGGAGLLLGWSLISPGDLPRLASLRTRAAAAIRLVGGAAAVLVVAGLIEGLITPLPLPPAAKFVVAGVAFTALCAYLGLAGRGPASAEE